MTDSFSTQPDEVLARATSQGALEAFDELVRRYQHRIYGFVLQLVANPADAREVTQDAFVKAYLAIGQYRPPLAFSSWLFAVARNKAIDLCRSRKPVSDQVPPEHQDLEDPAALLTRREDRSLVWNQAREVLPELHFQVVWLHYVEDMDVAQIAAVVRKTRTHVKVILFRARRLLAAKLRKSSESLQRTSGNRRCDPPALRAYQNRGRKLYQEQRESA